MNEHVVYRLLDERTGTAAFLSCAKCGVLPKFWLDEPDLVAAHERSGVCACGAPARKYYDKCDPCRHREALARQARNDAARFANATKIPMAEHEGWLSDGDERYWPDLDSALDHYDGADAPRPSHLWACSVVEYTINAEHVLDGSLEEHYEDAGERITSAHTRKLQAFLDAWCKETGIVSQTPDLTRAILIDPRADDDAATDEIEDAS